ncbi:MULTISPECIES: hypothetical protein [unclassified Peribacillus]|uniref:hypothetical protein n=1 Tax=unclassified Peribacillus TaxID=2675266 RepID=UPI001F5BBBDC|nr:MULTISPECIES: hypothetical protein [unclassified Peribacillus]
MSPKRPLDWITFSNSTNRWFTSFSEDCFFLIELKGQFSEKEDIHFVLKKKTGKSFIKIYRLVISDRYLNFGGIHLKIIDTIPFFVNNYLPSLRFLRHYYNEYPDVFKEYFLYHCKDNEERHKQSISKYPQIFSTIKQTHENIVPIINEIEEEYFSIYQVSFPIEVNLIVGGFGSNAYTYRQIIPNITFALEKLSPEPNHLKTIVAHEFGHVTHNIISNDKGIDWTKIQWNSPLTWLYQEGAATHFSRRTVPELHPSIYFSFNDGGYEWLSFAESNKQDVKLGFAKDLATCTPQDIYREWFSINGGEKFGHSRLGYFLGDMLFQHQISQLGEMSAIVAWKEHDFEEKINSWLCY